MFVLKHSYCVDKYPVTIKTTYRYYVTWSTKRLTSSAKHFPNELSEVVKAENRFRDFVQVNVEYFSSR